jgi:hypothetical protein
MSLLTGLRATLIYNAFGIEPFDEDFWPIWDQLIAIERKLA